MQSYLRIILLNYFVLFLVGCSGSKEVATQTRAMILPDPNPKVILMNFLISGTDEQELNSAKLVRQTASDGKLKRAMSGRKTNPEKGDLLLVFTDADMRPIEELVFPNPLIQQIEYPAGNGKMGVKTDRKQEVQFSVRVQLPPGSEYILIKRSTPGKKDNGKLLLKSKIETS